MQVLLIHLLFVGLSIQLYSSQTPPTYPMVTAHIIDGEVVFDSDEDFEETISAGFFQIKAPSDLNLQSGRDFAKTFMSNPRYNQFGMLDVINGYLLSEINQTVRFTLERDYWAQCHVNQQLVDGEPNYSIELQKLGTKINDICVQILRSILKRYELPEELWFEATGGAAYGEGSCFLLFNCYDPILRSRPIGIGEHKDWGHISLLDVTGPGLEAKINGEWYSINADDGYLIVNFGYALEKLLPGVSASLHQVRIQNEHLRTSTVVFLDPRVGVFREGATTLEKVGYIYDWDIEKKELTNGEPTTSFFTRLSNELFGRNQE